jgi:hypothetical protein
MLELLTIDSPKTRKGEAYGYLSGVLYLAPSDESGRNVCPFALRAGEQDHPAKSRCSETCLTFAGRGGMPAVRAARVRRTRLYFEDRKEFFAAIRRDIRRLTVDAEMWSGLVIRLDGTSDLGLAERIHSEFPKIEFVDYTKDPSRALRALSARNWHVTYSAHEKTTREQVDYMIGNGVNVSMVFAGELPAEYWGHRVIDGDEHDLRQLDPGGVIVGLRMKGVSIAFRQRGVQNGFARPAVLQHREGSNTPAA